MGKEKEKPFAQVFQCPHCGEYQFIFSLEQLREMGVNVSVIERVLGDDPEKMH